MRLLIFLIAISLNGYLLANDKVALLIGNANYGNISNLGNPVHDVKKVASVLETLGFAVTVKTNLNFSNFEKIVDEFSVKAQRAKISLFYYAGHGSQHAGENYLLPTDIRSIKSPGQLRHKAVSLGYVQEGMGDDSSKTNIILLDACRDNPFPHLAAGRQLSPGLAKSQTHTSGTLISYSTAPGKIALDGVRGKLSPYANSLLKHLRDGSKTLEDALKLVSQDTKVATQGRQKPWYESSLEKDVCLGKCDYSRNNTVQATVKTHKLTVRSNVRDDKVYVNNKFYGKTPQYLTLPEGEYRIRVSKSGYRDHNEHVYLSRDNTIRAVLAEIPKKKPAYAMASSYKLYSRKPLILFDGKLSLNVTYVSRNSCTLSVSSYLRATSDEGEHNFRGRGSNKAIKLAGKEYIVHFITGGKDKRKWFCELRLYPV